MVRSAPPQPPVERVRIERRGGLAGLRLSVDRDYASLSDGERDALHGVVAALAHGAAPLAAGGADRFGYRLQLLCAGSVDRCFDVPEDAMPVALAALVRPTLP